MKKKTVFRCPVEDYTCPYCDANSHCMLDNPTEECDEAGYYSEQDNEIEEGADDDLNS